MKVLHLVADRLNTHPDVETQWPGLLGDLWTCIPDAKPAKAARLMNKAIGIWKNTTCEAKQEEYIASLEQAFDAALDDLFQIRSIFRSAVAALSPPRYAGELCSTAEKAQDSRSEPLENQGAQRDGQLRLRAVVLKCLDYLELVDSKVQPARRHFWPSAPRSVRPRLARKGTIGLDVAGSGSCLR